WHKVREALEQHKAQRFRQGLATLMRPEEPLLEGCVVCHRDDIGASEIGPLHQNDPTSSLACRFCRDLYELGDELTRDKPYLVATRGEADGSPGTLVLPGRDNTWYAYQLVARPDESFARGFVINRWDLAAYPHSSLVPLFYAGYVPAVGDLPEAALQKEYEGDPDTQDFHTASMAGLAYAATGIDRVAMMRMDVDKLGQLLRRGFHPPSFSRLASFSRQLTLFFKYYLNGICQGQIGENRGPANLSRKTWES